jgi:hypothetical protein
MKTLTARSLMLIAALATMTATPAPIRADVQPLTVSASFLPGTESLLVRGRADAGSLVVLELSGTLDRDLPAVIIDRMQIVASSTNSFVAVLPYAPAFEHFATLSVSAMADGETPAIACCFHVQGPMTPHIH